MTATGNCGSYIHDYTFKASTPETCIGSGEMMAYEPIVSITPNPADDNIIIELVEPINQTANGGDQVRKIKSDNLKIRIFNYYGLQVYSSSMKEKREEISTSNLQEGLFIVEITDGLNSYKGRLIIKR
jgi:hypothetical protein